MRALQTFLPGCVALSTIATTTRNDVTPFAQIISVACSIKAIGQPEQTPVR